MYVLSVSGTQGHCVLQTRSEAKWGCCYFSLKQGAATLEMQLAQNVHRSGNI